MKSKRIQVGFFSILLLLIAVLSFFIFRAYIAPLFLSLVLFIVFEPVFHWMLHVSGKRKWLAATFTILVIILVILLPFVFFGFFLFQDAKDLYFQLSTSSANHNVVHDWAHAIQMNIEKVIPIINIDVEAYIDNWLQSIVGNLSDFFSGFVHIILDLVIVLLSIFYLYRDGESLKKSVFAFSPLPDTEDAKIFDRVTLAVNSVVKGSLAVALSQGMVAGIGFAFFGIPSPFLWGGVMAVMALIPTFGTGLVFTPAVLYLFFTNHGFSAFGLALWGIIAISIIDNFLGPHVIKRGIEIHPFLILLSVLGGVAFFGPIGFVAGPVILSLFLMLVPMFGMIVE